MSIASILNMMPDGFDEDDQFRPMVNLVFWILKQNVGYNYQPSAMMMRRLLMMTVTMMLR